MGIGGILGLVAGLLFGVMLLAIAVFCCRLYIPMNNQKAFRENKSPFSVPTQNLINSGLGKVVELRTEAKETLVNC